MDNQTPAPSYPPQEGAPAPHPLQDSALGAPVGLTPVAVHSNRDETYRRIPAEYTVPDEYRRPYGDATGDFRGPGYFYSIGAFSAALAALALTLYSWLQIGAVKSTELASSSRYNHVSLHLDSTSVIALFLVGLIPVGISIWLAIYSAQVNTGHVTVYTSKMKVFNTFAYIISGLSLLGLLGTLFLGL